MVEIRTLLSIFFFFFCSQKGGVCWGLGGGGVAEEGGGGTREMEKEAPFSLHPRSRASPCSARERRKAMAAALWWLLREESPVGRGNGGVRDPRDEPSPPS